MGKISWGRPGSVGARFFCLEKFDHNGVNQDLEDLWSKWNKSEANCGKIASLQCVKCANRVAVPVCSNCGGYTFVPGYATDGSSGLFCSSCAKGFSHWKCSQCQTDNPSYKTLWILWKV